MSLQWIYGLYSMLGLYRDIWNMATLLGFMWCSRLGLSSLLVLLSFPSPGARRCNSVAPTRSRPQKHSELRAARLNFQQQLRMSDRYMIYIYIYIYISTYTCMYIHIHIHTCISTPGALICTGSAETWTCGRLAPELCCITDKTPRRSTLVE